MGSDHWLVLAVWCVYALADILLLPAFAPEDWRVRLDAQSAFVTLYQAAVGFVIAFPLADAQLKRQRYAAFAGQALGLLAVSSALLEFALEPLLFDAKIIPVGSYLRLIEGGTVALLLTAVRLLLNRRRNERRLTELQKANAEAELQYLKGQINPHVLFNALNNIYAHALHKSEKTPDLILTLSDMLRYMIYDCSHDEVSLTREIAFISDYVDIQEMTLDGRGAVAFRWSGAVDGKRIFPFLLIPFVENCFKHSLDSLDDGIDITIDLEAMDDRVRFKCSNTFDPKSRSEQAAERSGIGLANVKRRLELLFDDDFEIDVSPGSGRFQVMLNVPVRP